MSQPRPLHQRRDFTPVSTTNPFRQSIIMRSESPFDDPRDVEPTAVANAGPYGTYGGSRHESAPSLSSVSSARQSATSLRAQTSSPPIAGARRTSNPSTNPFHAELDSTDGSSLDMPPPYSEGDRVRANSDSSLSRSEKERLRRRDLENDRRDADRLVPAPSRRGENSDRDRGDRGHERSERSERYYRDRERERERNRDRERGTDRAYSSNGRPRERRDTEPRSRRELESSIPDRRREDGSSRHGDGERRRYKESSRDDERHHRSSRSDKDRTRVRHRSKSESVVRKTKDGLPLDVIDKMDVTGLFGPGSFHHDGPFDACTPHRNKVARAPVAAFLADGPNNSLAVVEPSVGRYMQEASVFGRDPEIEMANAARGITSQPNQSIEQFDTHQKAKPVHGQTTMGLGSSTFMDGTPASKDAIDEASRDNQQGLGRSKSLLRRTASGRRPAPRPVRDTEPVTFETPATEKPDWPVDVRTASDSNGISRTKSSEDPVREKPSGLLGRVKSLRVGRR